MKKRTKITLVILVILIVLVAALCWWQRNNLTALKMSVSHSQDDLSQMMEKNNQRVEAVSDALNGVTVRDLTEEEKAALQEGSISPDELIDLLIGKEPEQPETPEVTPTPESTPETPESTPESTPEPTTTPSTQAAEPTPTPAPTTTPVPSATPATTPTATPTPTPAPAQTNQQDLRNQLARYIAEIYLMKAEYTAWLEAEHQATIDEYVALPEEQHTNAKKYEIGMKHMKIGLEREKECDKRMADLESKILSLLEELGEDTSLVNEIHAAYEEEKALKKAYYLGLH